MKSKDRGKPKESDFLVVNGDSALKALKAGH